MLKTASEAETVTRPDIAELIQRLSDDSRRWAEAELRLARIELRDLRNNAVRAVAFAIVAFAAAFCALVVLSQAAVVFLAPVVGGYGWAAMVVAGVLLVIVAISVMVLRSSMSWKADSLFFRWFSSHSTAEQRR